MPIRLPFVSASKVDEAQKQIAELTDKISTVQSENNEVKSMAYMYGHSSGYSEGMAAGEKWTGGITGSGDSLNINHYDTRQNVRKATYESLEAKAIVESFASNVAGAMLRLDVMPDYEILGITQEEAEEWSRNVNRRYHQYCKSKKQHRSQLQSWYQYLRFYAYKQQRDNDMFTRFFYSKVKSLLNPLQFEGIDPNQIRGQTFTSTANPALNNFDDGIERHPDGREKAYQIWVKDKVKGVVPKEIPKISEKTGRVMMVHGFTAEYDGQQRGYSKLTGALQELTNVTDFTLAAIQKAINQSNMVMSVENKEETPGNPHEDDTDSASGKYPYIPPTGAISGVTAESCGETSPRMEVPEVMARKEASLNVPGSTMYVLNKRGDQVKMLSNGAPGDQFDPVIRNFYDRICASLGTSSQVVLNSFISNYNGIRAALVQVWRRYKELRQDIDTDLCYDHFEMWISGEIAAGRVVAAGWSDPRLKAAWLNHELIGDNMPQSDPGREAKAIKDLLELNLTTQERESQNINGSSFTDNKAKNKKAFEDSPIPPWAKSSIDTRKVESKNGDEYEYEKEDEEDSKKDKGGK